MANWMAAESRREKHAGTKGVFREAAERRGMSTHALAEEDKQKKGKWGKRARMALAYEGAKH